MIRKGYVLRDLHTTTNTSSLLHSLLQLTDGNHATVLSPCLSTDLDNTHSEFEVEVVYAAA